MTTNNIDKLPESLIRPGRIDRKWYIGYACKDQIHNILTVFYGDLKYEISDFTNKIMNKYKDITIAQLQNYLIGCQTIDDAINNFDKFESYQK